MTIDIENLQAQIVELDKQHSDAYKTMIKIAKKKESLKKKIDNYLAKQLCDKNINLEYIMSLNWSQVEGAVYKKIDDWCIKNLKYLYKGGYLQSTNQVCFQLKFHKNEDFEPQYQEFLQLEPLVKPCKLEGLGKSKFFDIFEYTLSEYGTYYVLNRLSNNKWILCCDRYHNRNILQEFDDSRSCMEYVWQTHYYE